MQNNHQIDYIEFATTNIEDTKKFYSGVFGWKFVDYGPDYTSFQDGRLSGGFTTEIKELSRSPLVVIYANNLESSKSAIIKNNGKIAKDIFEFPGGKRFHFEDPNGNVLAVWSEK